MIAKFIAILMSAPRRPYEAYSNDEQPIIQKVPTRRYWVNASDARCKISCVVLKFMTEKVELMVTLPILKLMDASNMAFPSTFQISASLGLKDILKILRSEIFYMVGKGLKAMMTPL